MVQLDASLPAELAVGSGTCLFVSGSCSHPRRDVRRLIFCVDGRQERPIAHGVMPAAPAPELGQRAGSSQRGPHARWSAFWGFLPFEAVESPRHVSIQLLAALEGGAQARHRLGEIELLPRRPSIEADVDPGASEGPLVAICMATHEPSPRLVKGQIESLRQQTHRRWICLISDDCSSPERFDHLRSLVAEDRRFFVSRSPRHLGFYRNFERVLSMVPASAKFVALCDQDDRWRAEKLAALIAHIGSATLVYSDMRVIDESGRMLSETFWTYKRNSYTRLGPLLLENTVTGAASMFRRTLLDAALPFPPPLEHSVHDHWIASVALTTGSIAYVDRALYDYVQHHTSVTPEHPSAARRGRGVGARALRALAALTRLSEWRQEYFSHACRIALAARTLEMRFGAGLAPDKRRILRRVARLGDPPEPTAWLALGLLRPLIGRSETGWMERRLLQGIAWRRLASVRAGLRRVAQKARG